MTSLLIYFHAGALAKKKKRAGRLGSQVLWTTEPAHALFLAWDSQSVAALTQDSTTGEQVTQESRAEAARPGLDWPQNLCVPTPTTFY